MGTNSVILTTVIISLYSYLIEMINDFFDQIDLIINSHINF